MTTVKSVNKTDTVTLLSTFEVSAAHATVDILIRRKFKCNPLFFLLYFQSLENIVSASVDDIALCPGFGPQKVLKNRIYKLLTPISQ